MYEVLYVDPPWSYANTQLIEGPERDAIQAELTRVLEIADAKVKK